MNELDFYKGDLSIPAREALTAVDAYIDTMNGLYGSGSVKRITLHHECYDDLERSIKYHTEDSQSIVDHTYRGAVFVRDMEIEALEQPVLV